MKFFITFFICFTIQAHAQQKLTAITGWKSYLIPTSKDSLIKYNWSKYQWRVLEKEGNVYADSATAASELPFKIVPNDQREQNNMKGQVAYIEVDSGYLVSFWYGEFGGSLYWFDKKGDTRKFISRAMIVQFIRRNKSIYAIGGLAHMGFSSGGIVALKKEAGNWKVLDYLNLNDAALAVAKDNRNNLVVITNEHLYLIDENKKIDTLAGKGFWDLLYPASILVHKNQVFAGMRQGIFKFDLVSHKQEWLMPY